MSSLSLPTQLITAEAARRGIAVQTYADINRNVAELTYHNHREFIYQSQTDQLGRVTSRLFTDNKYLTTVLLRQAGFPTAPDIITNHVAAATAFLQQHKRVVVKPLSNSGGAGVTPNITTPAELAAAIQFARAHNAIADPEDRFLCQAHIAGCDFRVLVIGQEHIFASQRVPAHVVGDGEHTITELVKKRNTGLPEPYHIRLNDRAHQLLQAQHLTPDDVPRPDHHVTLSPVANAHSGGTVIDATDSLTASVRAVALAVARHFNCSIVGIDFISPDIRLEPGVIIELNACPDIAIHHFPNVGQSRDVAHTIIDTLFPETVH